jgi:hypothetical protein
VSKNRLIDSLKDKNIEKNDTEVSVVIGKIENKKRLSSKEFLKGYETIWKEGPTVNYQNIGAKEMLPRSINKNATLW